MKALCDASSNFSSLTNLNLTFCSIGAEGMEALCAASSNFSSLTNLNLCGNSIGAEGMKALCAASSNFSSLTNLYLGENNLGDESIESLVLVIKQCPLEMLYLRNIYPGTQPRNHFSHEVAKLLEQVAKAFRPGMELRMP